MEWTNIKVLLIKGHDADTASIRVFLQNCASPTFHVQHRDSPEEALDFILENKKEIDIILLDLELVGHENAEKVFQQVHTLVTDVPIIIFTGVTEHDLAMLIIKEGAADNVTREMFNASPEGLKDAIEFSLSRNEILKRLTERDPVQSREMHEKSATALKRAQETAAAELKESEEKAAAEMRAHEEKSAAEMKDIHLKHLVDVEYHKQVLFWMSGGYSIDGGVNNADREESINRIKIEYEHCAAELKRTQEFKAQELKKAQKRSADALREAQAEKALELRRLQDMSGIEFQESQQRIAIELRKAWETLKKKSAVA